MTSIVLPAPAVGSRARHVQGRHHRMTAGRFAFDAFAVLVVVLVALAGPLPRRVGAVARGVGSVLVGAALLVAVALTGVPS